MVAALIWEKVARARLAESLRGQSAIRFCEHRSELVALLASGAVGALVVDKRDSDGKSTLHLVRRVRSAFPALPIVLYTALAPDASRDVLRFARAGVNDLIFRGVDDTRAALRGALQAAADDCLAKLALSEIEPLVPANVLDIVRYCVENARGDIGVGEVAAALSVHRKTLVNRMRAAGYPPPSWLISWGRLLHAARLLDGRSVTQVATLVGFPTGTALRNMMKRYTGLTTTEVRRHGGMRCVLRVFKRELAAASGSYPDH